MRSSPYSEVDLVAEFVTVPSRIRRVRALKVGDVLPIELPASVTASVQGVPVLECEYGSHKNQRALRVQRVINHSNPDGVAAEVFVKGHLPTAQESDHE